METVTACPICHTDQMTPLIAIDRWTIAECRICQLGMLSPRPDAAELSDLYQETYFDRVSLGQPATQAVVERRVRESRKRVTLVRSYLRRGRLLDVGCATGYFLEAARRAGFSVAGIEHSGWAVEEANRLFGVNARAGELSDLIGRDERYDGVTMWHVLEHTRDPKESLHAVKTLLKKGGVVFIELPNYLSVDARREGVAWSGWDVPYHLWHFTPASLSRLLTLCGFRVLRIKRHPSSAMRNHFRSIPWLWPFRNLLCLFYSGRDFTIVATPSP